MREHREERVVRSGRLRFALVGALACLGMALFSELIFSLLHIGQSLQHYQAPVLLFPVTPQASTVAVSPQPATENTTEPPAPAAAPPSQEQRQLLQTSCYLVDDQFHFGRIDIATGEFTLISRLPRQMTDIAYDSHGVLYATGYPERDIQGNFEGLYRIDPHTGASTLVATIRGVSTVAGLVFSSDDVLLGGTKDGKLISIDVHTGAWQTLMNFPYSTAGDLAFDRSGFLYVSTDSDELIRLEPGTGTYRAIGPMGFTGVRGLGRGPDDVMYGFSFTEKKIFAIDLLNGHGRAVSDFSRSVIGIGGGISFATEALPLPPLAGSHPTAPAMRDVLRARSNHRTITPTTGAATVTAWWHNPFPALLTVIFWTALLGAVLPLLLRTAQKSFLEVSLIPELEDWQTVGYGAGFGAIAGFAGQLLYTLALFSLTLPIVWILHALSFALLGGILARGLSRHIPHIHQNAALIAVPAGSVIASLLLQWALISGAPVAGRLMAATVIGTAIGILIALEKVEEIVHAVVRPLEHSQMHIRSVGSLSRSRSERKK